MAVKNYVQAIPLITFDTSTFTGSYQLATPAGGLPNPCFLIIYINRSNRDVTISYDGTTDQDISPADSGANPRNFQTNAQPTASFALLAQGTQIWVKGTAGTGNFYVVGYYNPKGAS